MYDEEKKSAPEIASDGIALDLQNGYLYYHALTGHTLYRIRTGYLNDATLSESELKSKVEPVTTTAAADGMLEARDGSVYLTDVESNAIVRWDAATNKLEPVIADKGLLWPDSMSWGANGELYVTASQIENMPRFNGGKSARTQPYQVFKVTGLAGQAGQAK